MSDVMDNLKKAGKMSRSLDNYDTELIVSIARDVVAEIAPDEIRLFSSISEAYKKNPERILKKRRVKDTGLELGPVVLVPVLTTTILFILHQTFVQISVNASEKGAWILLRRLSKKIFERSSSSKQENKPSSPKFSPEELEYIHKTIIQAARENNLANAKGRKQFADTVYVLLAIRQTGEEKTK